MKFQFRKQKCFMEVSQVNMEDAALKQYCILPKKISLRD